MSAAEDATPVSDAETDVFFDDLNDEPAVVLAVSGGPDSTALLVLAARWRKRRKRGPKLLAVTVDHGLRPDSRREAAAVKRLAARLEVPHRTVRWTGDKPARSLQEKARGARYRLLAEEAHKLGARAVLTAHTVDDQAETILFRLARGSGLTGLAGMSKVTPMPGFLLVRPLLDLPKARLLATLRAANVPFADDPSNRDPQFARVRMRALMPALVKEGLDARRLGALARRIRRAEDAIEAAVDEAAVRLTPGEWPEEGPIVFDAGIFSRLAAEIALRLIGRAIARVGDEGPVELGKLESLADALLATMSGGAPARFRRTLAGAVVTFDRNRLTIERAPARRTRLKPS